MKQFYLLILALLLYSHIVEAQNACFPGRYKSRVFTSYTKYGDVKYGEAPKTWPPYFTENLKMDIYVPKGDTLLQRPIILFAHASAFLFSDKGCDVAKAYADTFTRRGYVFASIGYRLGFNAADGESAMRAAYAAIQDGKAAIRFIKEYATTYGVDTNNIIFAGSSAGGIMALYAAYADKETERPADTYAGIIAPDMGCWDCSGNNFKHSSKIKAAISMWGAVLDPTMIDDPNAPPCMLIHGKDDLIVPYGTGHPFQAPWFPESSGSEIIDQQANKIGLTHEFYPFDIFGIDHEFYGSANGYWINPLGPNQYWDTVTTLMTQYSFKQIQPITSTITGKTTVYQNELEQDYSVDYHAGSTYCWEVTGGLLLSSNANTATVLWNSVGTAEIKVTEANHLLAEGNPQLATIDVVPGTTTSLNALQVNQKMKLYPNPSHTNIRLEVNTTSPVCIRISNSIGQEINSIQITSPRTILDVSHYPTGMYSCQVWLTNGELYAIQKIIVE